MRCSDCGQVHLNEHLCPGRVVTEGHTSHCMCFVCFIRRYTSLMLTDDEAMVATKLIDAHERRLRWPRKPRWHLLTTDTSS